MNERLVRNNDDGPNREKDTAKTKHARKLFEFSGKILYKFTQQEISIFCV